MISQNNKNSWKQKLFSITFLSLFLMVILFQSVEFDDRNKITNLPSGSLSKTPVCYVNTTGKGKDVVIVDDYAYVANGYNGLAIIDITDPTNPGTPIIVDTSNGAYGGAFDIHVENNYVYIADGNEGLAIIDISDPTNPGTPIYMDTTYRAEGIDISGDFAFLSTYSTDGFGDYSSKLSIINISDPLNPDTPNNININDYAIDIEVYNGFVYIANGNNGLAVVNVTNCSNIGTPVYQATCAYARDLYIENDIAYIADGSYFSIYNVSDPLSITRISNVSAGGWAYNCFIDNNVSYIAITGGVAKIDISDINNLGDPQIKEISGNSYDVYISGDYLYVGITVLNEDYSPTGLGLAILEKNFTPTALETNDSNNTLNHILALIVPYAAMIIIALVSILLGRKAKEVDIEMKKSARNAVIIGILVVNGIFFGAFVGSGMGYGKKDGMFPGSLIYYGDNENLTNQYFVANGYTPFVVYCDHYFFAYGDPGIDITVKIYENETNTLVDQGVIYMYSTASIQHDDDASFASQQILSKSKIYRIEFEVRAGSLKDLRIYSPRSYLEFTYIYVAYNESTIFFIISLLSFPTTFILGLIEIGFLKSLRKVGKNG